MHERESAPTHQVPAVETSLTACKVYAHLTRHVVKTGEGMVKLELKSGTLPPAEVGMSLARAFR